MKSVRRSLQLLLSLLVLILSVPQAQAFYAWQGEQGTLEARGMLQGTALTLRNPDNTFYYNRRSISGFAGSARLMVDAGFGGPFSFELHAEQSYTPLTLQRGGSNFVQLRDVERSDLLDWSFDSKRAHLVVDRLNLQYASERLNVKIGRQPVNLAATYYFTPNDFFAPFAAQTFFRAYKPGVDAIRADIQLADLSQLSLISVLGYSLSTNSDNGWSNRHEPARNSYVARASTVFADFELALLVGSIRKDIVVGGDFQGELFDWLGVRGEGHLNIPDQQGQKRRIEFAMGLEHRWESTLTLRVEQFYHGGGSASSTNYSVASLSQGFYMARNYSAIGANYEFTPLLSGDMTLLYNWIDNSSLLALYGLYSLADESELAFSVSTARGRGATGAAINSEFGLYPASLSLELRSYF